MLVTSIVSREWHNTKTAAVLKYTLWDQASEFESFGTVVCSLMQLSFSGLDNTYTQPQLTASAGMIWHTQHNPWHLEDAQQIARYFSTLYPFCIRSQNSTAWKIHSPGIDFKIRALRQGWEPKLSVGTALEQGIHSPFRKSYFQKALELTLRDIWGRDSF